MAEVEIDKLRQTRTRRVKEDTTSSQASTNTLKKSNWTQRLLQPRERHNYFAFSIPIKFPETHTHTHTHTRVQSLSV